MTIDRIAHSMRSMVSRRAPGSLQSKFYEMRRPGVAGKRMAFAVAFVHTHVFVPAGTTPRVVRGRGGQLFDDRAGGDASPT